MLFLTHFSSFIRPLPLSHYQTLIENTPKINGPFNQAEREWQRHNDTSKKNMTFKPYFFNKSAVSRKKIGGKPIFTKCVSIVEWLECQ